MSDLTEKQRGLYNQLQNAILSLTDWGRSVAKILQGISRDDLRAILTTADIHRTLDGGEYTSTLLGFAICSKDQELVKIILDAAKEQDILKEVLTTTGIYKKSFTGIHKKSLGVVESTLTPFGFAIYSKDYVSVKVILDAAKEQDILEEVLAGIGKDDREKIKDFLEEKANPSSNENVEQLKNIAKTTNKLIIIGIACGVIAGLAVRVGCFAFGVALPILAIVGIAVATGAAVGLIAGSITYAVSKPNSVTDNPDVGNLVDAANQIS